MFETDIALPSKPRAVVEEGDKGVYEIDGLYAGYGHTLGNSLRRIILSSLPGVAITTVKIEGVPHEFSTIEGVVEDVVTILLNLKRVRFRLDSEEAQTVTLSAKGPKKITAKDIKTPSQAKVLTPDQHIAEITEKGKELKMEITIERGMGYVPKESWKKEKTDIGAIVLDATFTPIRRANYEVELMRVGERTDYNRLRITIETDGSISPRESLEYAVDVMIKQLRAVRGVEDEEEEQDEAAEEAPEEEEKERDTDVMKTRTDSLDLSARTANALESAGIRTIGGLVRKAEEDLLDIEGLGAKGIQEIKRALSNFGETLK